MMRPTNTKPLRSLARAAVLLASFWLLAPASADEAAIRSNLARTLPDLPHIDEISPTPVQGVYEVRMGTTILYADEQGAHLFEGHLIDAESRTNLTAARLAALSPVDFKSLPLEDAVVWKQGTGARKLVVFADPNCGFCKKFERDLQSLKDLTVYTFLYPILGGDSPEKAKAIWCSADRTKTWRDWMLSGAMAKQTPACDTSALDRNVALGKKFGVRGTPGLIFEDGRQVAGAAEAGDIERGFVAARSRQTP